MNRCLLPALLAGCLAPGLAAAQDVLPAERAQQEKAEAARVATAEAYEAIQGYGRGAPVAPVSAQALRHRAMGRLNAPIRKTRRPAFRVPGFDPVEDSAKLLAFREAILARLNALDPERFPEAEEEDEAEPGRLVLKIFDVQDLTYAPVDHVAAPVGLGSAYGGGGGGGVGGGVVGGVLCFDDEEDNTLGVGISPDKLVELIEFELGEDDAEGSVEYSGGQLMVRKTAAGVAKIKALLDRIAVDRGGLVDLEVRIYRMPPTFFAKVRHEANGLSDAGEALLNKAVADGKVGLISSHRVVAHDGQRVYVRRGGSQSLVADLEVNQTGVIPVLNPVINVVSEGLVVELRPLVDRARKVVMLDAALSLSRLRSPIEAREIKGVELDLPFMDIARTGASACVTLGRGALMGGVFKIDQSGKPMTCVVYVRPNLVQSR
jgi:hypothetical protein